MADRQPPGSGERVRRRGGQACGACHTRKVRCDVSITGTPCSNCRRDGEVCARRERQSQRRKRQGDAGAPGIAVPLDTAPSPIGPAATSAATPATLRTYLGRNVYLGPEASVSEEGVEEEVEAARMSASTDATAALAKVALELPPRPVRDALLDTYWAYCHPWTPVLDHAAFMRDVTAVPPLVLQAVLLAGARLHAASAAAPPPLEFYTRAKTLFWLGAEHNALNALVAACILQWWTPHGPERFSIDTAYTWLRLAVSIAFQLGLHRDGRAGIEPGLHRRIWWSLVARDCCISAAHGRPRAINLKDSNVPLPWPSDLCRAPNTVVPAGLLFRAYVDICTILGDVQEFYLRKPQSQSQRAHLGRALFHWCKSLHQDLRLSDMQPEARLKPYMFEVRQLHVIFLSTLVMLHRQSQAEDPPSPAAILGSALIAGLFEEFLARDEVRRLAPTFTFYLLVASITQLCCYTYDGMRPSVEHNLQTINRAQTEMQKNWPSAIGSQRTAQKMQDWVMSRPTVSGVPSNLMPIDIRTLFDDYDREMCNQWDFLMAEPVNENGFDVSAHDSVANVFDSLRTGSQASTIVGMQPSPMLSIDPRYPRSPVDLTVFDEFAGTSSGNMGDWFLWDEICR